MDEYFPFMADWGVGNRTLLKLLRTEFLAGFPKEPDLALTADGAAKPEAGAHRESLRRYPAEV